MITFAVLTVVPTPDGATEVVVFTFVRSLWGFILSSTMSLIYRRWVNFSSPLKTIFLALFSSIFFACIWVYVMIIYSSVTGPTLTYEAVTARLWSDLFNFSTTLIGWSAFYLVIKHWLELQAEKERTLEAKNLAREAELRMLRYQLNPHFLFNSLNSASALVRENPPRAEKMIDELSDFLRYSLVDTKTDKVKLENEIESVKNYLNIEQIRFEEKLEVKFNISPDVLDFKVPYFLLHPLIENAVKYGMQTSKSPLQIEINAFRKNNLVLIKIVNTGKWIERERSNPNGTNVGIENVNKRLDQFFPDQHKFQISKEENKVEISLEFNQ